MASRNLGTLTVDMVARIGGFVDGMSKAEREADRRLRSIQKSFRNTGNAIKTVLAGIAVGATFDRVIGATVEQERAVAQLEQTLRSTGRLTPELSQGLQGYAASLQQVSTFGDEAIIASEALLATFTQIGGQEFNRAQQAILDIATAMGTDLKSASLQVGKALNDPAAGVSALTEVGVSFSEAQKEVIKDLANTGRVAEAQRLILKELETEFGGSARAARDILGGALQSLSNTFGDLLEGDSNGGGVKGATGAINELTETLNQPEVKEGFQTIVNGLLTLTKWSASAASAVAKVTDIIGEEIAIAVGGISGDDIDRLEEKAKKLQKALELAPFTGVNAADVQTELDEINKRIDFYNQNLKPLKPAIETSPDSNQPNVPTRNNGGGSAADADAAKSAIEAQAKAQQKLAESYRAVVVGLSEQRTALQLTERQAFIYDAQLRLSAGATDEMQASVAELAGRLYDEKAAMEAASEAQQIQAELYQQTRTEAEKFGDELQRLTDLRDAGTIDDELYTRAVRQAGDAYQQLVDQAKDSTDQMGEFAIEAARSIQDSLGDGLYNAISGNFEDIGDNFLDTLNRMAAAAVAAQLAEKLFGDYDTTGQIGGLVGSAGGAIGDFFGGFFAEGGRPDPGKVSVIGEHGPELFIPEGVRGTVVPLDPQGLPIITQQVAQALPELAADNGAGLQRLLAESADPVALQPLAASTLTTNTNTNTNSSASTRTEQVTRLLSEPGSGSTAAGASPAPLADLQLAPLPAGLPDSLVEPLRQQAMETGQPLAQLFDGFFADGGRPDPYGTSVVGENGRELFIPDSLSSNPPRPQPSSREGGGLTVNQYFGTQSVPEIRASGNQAARQVYLAQQEANRRNG